MADGSGRCRTVTCPVRKLAQFEPDETSPFVASLVTANSTIVSARSFSVNEPKPLSASQLEVELMQQIDAVCRRFEADWRAGAQNPLDDYLADIPDEGRAALRALTPRLSRGVPSPGPGRFDPEARMLVRWSPPLHQLPAGTAGRAGSSAGRVSLPVQLLLRSRRLRKEDDAVIGPFSQQKGLPW
jgi:hypothetical protein